MNLAGLPILRASVAHDLLDPTFDARGVRWQRDHGGLEEAFPRRDDPLLNQEWTRSPFFQLLASHEPMLRRRLEASYRRDEFPMLDRFQDEGATDYVAFASRNLGSPRRLDFTVLGPAVNEAARIEAFRASLEQPVIVSTAFADASGQARRRLVRVGRYAMKGIARPQELFTLDPAHALAESGS